MFSSVVLDVAVALVFLFLAVSLATSSIVEAIASVLKLRSSTLRAGVKDLLNDPHFDGLAAALYAHALINPRGPGPMPATPAQPAVGATALTVFAGAEGAARKVLTNRLETNLPAYIKPKQFADALADVLSLSRSVGGALPSVDELLASVNAAVPAAANPQINQLLTGMIVRCNGDLTAIKKELSDWFDNGMDRLSGAYKRHTQVISFVAALVLSVFINADAVQLAQRVWAQPALIETIKTAATADATIGDNPKLAQSLPLGWAGDSVDYLLDDSGAVKPRALVFAVIGWFITAFATLFGAPFWFDTLQKIVRLKGSGPSPDEKTNHTAAAG